MWIITNDMPVQTYGKHGKEFLLNLQYCKYFGHDNNKTGEVVTAIWDSVNECFFEKKLVWQLMIKISLNGGVNEIL